MVGGKEEGVATTWSARPVAHLGPIKETWRPRPPHALMHDAHSPMHSNEYYFMGMETEASFCKDNTFIFEYRDF